MGRTGLHAPPGVNQARRIQAIREYASGAGESVRQYQATGYPLGWLKLVIKGPKSSLDMRGCYGALDYLSAFKSEPPPIRPWDWVREV